MSNKLLPLALSVFVFCIQNNSAKENCYLSSQQLYMKWVEGDGSLVFPSYRFNDKLGIEEDNSCECYSDEYNAEELQKNLESTVEWTKVSDSSSCIIEETQKILKCEGSDIHHLPPPKTINIDYINEYIVSSASLTPLPPFNFKGLSIKDLIIQNSSLNFISDDVFKSIKSLNTLTISGNSITTFNNIDKIFKDLSSVKAIYLENNQLRNMNCIDNTARTLENLEFLSLAYNPLALVDFRCLKNTNLTYLNLKNVYIDESVVQSMELSTLPRTLAVIDLSFSTITNTALKTALFMLNSHSITTLSAANVDLVTIPFEALAYLKHSLRYLSLNGNDFSDDLFYSRMESTSVEFQELQELDLRQCNMKVIDKLILNSFPNLNKLNLARNMITIIEPSLLTFSPTLEYLDISSNNHNITFSDTITSKNTNSELNKLTGNSSLKVLNLSNNIFNSSQNSKTYNETFELLTELEVLSLCNSTLNLNNINAMSFFLDLKKLDLSNTLKNDLDNLLIPLLENTFHNLKCLEELQFSNNGFNFSLNSVSIFSPLNAITLMNLANNSISTISYEMFDNLTNLKTLILCNNYISSWNSTILPKSNQIEKIDLSFNKITQITKNMMKDFSSLKTLNLKGNPLICSTDTNYFLCAAKSNKDLELVDSTTYKCLDLNYNKSLSFNDSLFCTEFKHIPDGSDKESFLNILTPLSIITFIIILGIVTTMNRMRIKNYVIRAKQSTMSQLLKSSYSDVNNHRFIYDVFISYSDIDRAWVMDYLIPFIERESSMNVCFHERDFQVGLSILENIIESIGKSRCLLLVISESFIKSRWCQFEMHLAQHHAIETKKEQLIMVLLEDIPKQNRPKTLHHLMSTRTYLIWPKQPSKEELVELFWKRLQRAIRNNQNII